MSEFIPWDSQPLDLWAEKYAGGKFVDLDGRRTHYIEKGEGEAVILLHGFFYDSYLWDRNIDALAEHFKVYALDLWGCGYSTREPLEYSYPLYAEQVSLFMDAVGVRRASFVGQSMGGGTAIQFCVANRQRVNKLLLVDAAGIPNPLPPLGKFLNLPGIGEFLLSRKTNAVRKMGLKQSFIHDKRLITDSYFENVTRAHKIRNSSAIGLSIQRRNFFDKLIDKIRVLAGMDVSVLIVWGREDKALPLRCGLEMHGVLRNSQLEIMDGAGHVPNFERADDFNRLAISFLKKAEEESVTASRANREQVSSLLQEEYS